MLKIMFSNGNKRREIYKKGWKKSSLNMKVIQTQENSSYLIVCQDQWVSQDQYHSLYDHKN
ncbi:MAG TPA: hypothetical protein PKM16_02595 [Bacteroidia bacterium]|nr:hypothetical protein [Bacteroidia bacterium]